jgi:Condensation domain
VSWHRSYMAGPDSAADLGWWRAYLDGMATAPGTRPGGSRPMRPAGRGAIAPPAADGFRDGWLNLRLPGQTATVTLALARGANSTLYMVMLAAYALVLSVLEGRDDVLVISPYALRARSEWEGLIGWFVNRVPVRVRARDELPFGEFMAEVRAASMAAFGHGKPPFELLREDLGLPDAVLGAQLSVVNTPSRGVGFRGFGIDVVPDDSGREFAPTLEVYSPLRSPFLISVTMRERGQGVIAGGLEFDESRLPADRAQSFADAFLAVLAAASADPAISCAALRRLAADVG